MKQHNPILTLVGAGPGDPDLLTIKGQKAIASASVILYDALANADLLDLAPKSTLKVYVGKRKGDHSFTQEEINELIVHYAFEYGHVVRLKGGDPFIFGRGSEEVAYAEAHGISCTVVPGISSAYGVSSAIGIPLTARGVAEGFWVITGTRSDQQLSNDISLAIQSTATIVILMGMSKLGEIMTIFETNGKNDIPVAIIQNGTTPQQQHCIGTAATILEKANACKIRNPAIIVVGEVVTLCNYWKETFHQFSYAY